MSDKCPGCVTKCPVCDKPLPADEWERMTGLQYIDALGRIIKAHEKRIAELERITITEGTADS